MRRWLSYAALLILIGTAASASTCLLRAEDAPKKRVVSIGSAVTEIVYALGAEDSLVGVDTSSLYPEAATKLPQVGYERVLASEGILSLKPGVVIAMSEAGPPAVLAQVKEAGVTLVSVPAKYTVDAAKEKIRIVAEALGKVEEGRKLSAQLDESAAKALALLAKAKTKPKVMFIYARGGGSVNVSGTGTAADAMIGLAGGENAVTGYTGYKPITSEAVVAAAPDIILLTRRGLESTGGEKGLLEQPGIALTPAGKSGRIIALDDVKLLNFGPRLGEALLELIQKIHPELATATP